MSVSFSFPSPPIGVFDSGVGGLTVLRQIQRLLPSESVLYFADTANVPYGDKPIAVVRDLALRLTDALLSHGSKLILMASGTSTVAGLDAAQERWPGIPIIGTIDVGAQAALAATDGSIGVLATNATAQSLAFTQAVQRLSPGRTVTEQGCPRFVPLVESGCAESAQAEDAARQYLFPLLDAGAQAIILGCTHFPFLLPMLQKAAAAHPSRLRPVFVDPAEEAVRAAKVMLEAQNLLAPADSLPTLRFAASGDPADFRLQASRLLGWSLPPASLLIF